MMTIHLRRWTQISVALFALAAAAAQQSPTAAADQALKAQQWEKAKALYQQAVDSNATDGKAWYGLGVAALQAGDAATAVTAFQKSMALGATPAYSLYNLACAYARSGDGKDALASLDKLVSIAPRLVLQANKDDDLAVIRSDTRFSQIMERAQEAVTPCQRDAHSREFDFWIGEWDVFNGPTGPKVGASRIEKSLDGCLLIENWQGGFGDTGKSFNTIDPATGKWQQYWVASNGTVTVYDGGMEGGSMRFLGSVHARGTSPAPARLTFTPLSDGSVRQHGESKAASGDGWVTTYDFIYRKKQ